MLEVLDTYTHVFFCRIADIVFRIRTRHSYTMRLCIGYRVDAAEGVDLAATDEDIEFERQFAETYRVELLECAAVYRQLCSVILRFDGLLLHASAVAVDGHAYLFSAPSGTGKSTHVRLWREHFGSRAVMINDDKPLVRFCNGILHACGTPWCGKENLSNNLMLPVRGICFISRSEYNWIQPLPASEAVPFLLNQTFRPGKRADMEMLLASIGRLLRDVPVYKMGCNISDAAVQLAYEAMK